MKIIIVLLMVFGFQHVKADNNKMFISSGITHYAKDEYGNSLEVGFEYSILKDFSIGLSYEKFEAAYYEHITVKYSKDFYLVINTSYALPKLNINYYPLNLNRHKVKIGTYFTRGRLTSDRPSYFDLKGIYNTETEQNIINADFGIGDYIEYVNGMGFIVGYSYLILPEKMNVGIHFDYLQFYPSFNSSYHFVPFPVSLKLVIGFIL